ncbi:hypothetical protein GGR53DRAFT_114445 [Hypoxylon sp. FL1150]|nr:hypothetical protein GGR53DRAFT_114445 [Hypoxylon sp. FL1150]
MNSDTLPGLQSKSSVEHNRPESFVRETGPESFNLASQYSDAVPQYSLETRSNMLFSTDHLRVIFDDALLLQEFTSFLGAFRPRSIPVLTYYLGVMKAVKAIGYVNSITRELVAIKGLEFTEGPVSTITHEPLLKKADEAFKTLAREDLPAYITHSWVCILNETIKRNIRGTLQVNLKPLSEELAGVFCLTDPSRRDNPIVFASKEFHDTTQYGMEYALGRNCHFPQGSNANMSSVKRMREQLEAGKENCETFLEYRRDGSSFINLLMIAPLFDSRGVIRYHIGAQVDVSGLVKECTGLDSLKRLVEQKDGIIDQENGKESGTDKGSKNELYELAEMFNPEELNTIRQSASDMHHTHQKHTGSIETESISCGPKQRDANPVANTTSFGGNPLPSIYKHYLLVRPHPHLRILFASPSMRVPGILQSSFMLRIGGPKDTHEPIIQKFAEGHVFTEKVRWITKTDSHGKGRYIHCTPLLGADRAVGVWMVVLVDDEVEARLRGARVAPPVDFHIGRQRPFDEDMAGSPSGEEVNKKLNEHRPPSRLHTRHDAS